MTEDKPQSAKDSIKKIKKQNPGVRVKQLPGGGFQISNPKAPSKLLTSLIKQTSK